MKHQYSRSAFRKAADNAQGSQNLLAELYARLVHIELALKDHNPAYNDRIHDIVWMLKELKNPTNSSQIALNTWKVEQLANSLEKLKCTNIAGSVVSVKASKYPYIRYLIHSSEHSAGSGDQEIQEVISIVYDIEKELKKISIWP